MIEVSSSQQDNLKVSCPEKFRQKLIDQYELTSVSIINVGIAGDNMLSMMNR